VPAGFCVGRRRRCPNKATFRGYCDQCRLARDRAYEQGRPSAAARGYGAEWRKTRAAFLEVNDRCECDVCLMLPLHHRPEATEVDHIDGLGPLGPQGHDWSNLRAMTHAHHSARTAADQPGGWAKRTRPEPGASGNL